ncbi:MarR family transcriptional regulator [Gordonia spumicola]|uniref:MarR family transcriptional regulator n=1 Tax=Gordonia spumicola TaxID=589161 RepID=A0A7I9V5L7_9ACTN|nr:MarR family winged helix-turn-helix transcriptional regulator [Gordonia spumicola]GEE00482.1 MarR family transcriptional regulator [Gordonia spumicola]
MKPTRIDGRIGYRMVRTAMRVRKAHADALAECGLLPSQHAVLAVLAADGPEYQKRLAAKTTVDAGDLVGHLDDLQERGYVVRERDPGDRRRHIVRLSDDGRVKLAEADRLLDGVEATLFGALDADQRVRLLDAIDEVYSAAEAQARARHI